ncbi:hypothetical protein KCU99_g409, partial [Aureobasidium melanogenum]
MELLSSVMIYKRRSQMKGMDLDIAKLPSRHSRCDISNRVGLGYLGESTDTAFVQSNGNGRAVFIPYQYTFAHSPIMRCAGRKCIELLSGRMDCWGGCVLGSVETDRRSLGLYWCALSTQPEYFKTKLCKFFSTCVVACQSLASSDLQHAGSGLCTYSPSIAVFEASGGNGAVDLASEPACQATVATSAGNTEELRVGVRSGIDDQLRLGTGVVSKAGFLAQNRQLRRRGSCDFSTCLGPEHNTKPEGAEQEAQDSLCRLPCRRVDLSLPVRASPPTPRYPPLDEYRVLTCPLPLDVSSTYWATHTSFPSFPTAA